jgi:hypothetical protein
VASSCPIVNTLPTILQYRSKDASYQSLQLFVHYIVLCKQVIDFRHGFDLQVVSRWVLEEHRLAAPRIEGGALL